MLLAHGNHVCPEDAMIAVGFLAAALAYGRSYCVECGRRCVHAVKRLLSRAF